MRISIFGSLRAAPAQAPRLVYRLRHWPESLPAALRTADVLRALSLMSNRPVNRDWILRNSRLKPATLDQLLALLAARDDLEVVDAARFPASAP
jgi:hypothetical protein